jgi:hypothetical protein
MQERIDHLKSVDIGEELTAWQKEDLHRRRGFTMRSRRAGKASTIVRPHSRFEMRKGKRYQRRIAKRVAKGGKKAFLTFQRWQVRTSTRAILRAGLLQQLQERVAAMVADKLKW